MSSVNETTNTDKYNFHIHTNVHIISTTTSHLNTKQTIARRMKIYPNIYWPYKRKMSSC